LNKIHDANFVIGTAIVKLEENKSFIGIGYDNTLHWAATMGT
jgi:hypothetical protein